MCVIRLLVLVFVCNARGGMRNNGASSTTDPVLNKLRSQLMANNYDYEQSDSIEKALRMGGAQDAAQPGEDHTEDQPTINDISDESELSDFGMDRNVLNGYITDMSDINVKPVPRTNDDTFMADGEEPDTAQNVDELSDVEPADLSEPEAEAPADAPAKQTQGLSIPELTPSKSPQPEPTTDPAEKQPDQKPPVMRTQTDLPEPEQMPNDLPALDQIPDERAQAPAQPPQPAQLPQPPQHKIHVVSPYIAANHTTETVPYKVLEGHGQNQGRRSGAGAMRFLQMELNDTVVVAPLGPGPMPDFQLPSDRRQYREISEDEEVEEEVTSTNENLR